MHIVMVNNYLYLRGGSERVMFEEVRLLRRRQATVNFFSRRQERNITTEHDALFPEFIDPLALSVTGQLRHIPRIMYDRRTYQLFSRFLHQLNPQLIHSHNIYGGLTSAVCDVARHQGRPMVMTLHDYKLICPAYLMSERKAVCAACHQGAYIHCLAHRCHKGSFASSLIYTLESCLTRWAGKYDAVRYLVCPSQFMREEMIAAGFPAERVIYLPNGIDIGQYEPCYAPGEYVLFVGRLAKEKGAGTLLAAMRDLPIPLAIAGDGPLRGALEAYVQRHAMADRVTFYGHQSGPALTRLYQGAAFLVLPSECFENAPMAILEAFSYGKAAIGARVGGIPELIDHQRTGVLVRPGEVDDLRDAILATWQDRRGRVEMGRAGRERVHARFTLQRHVDDLQALYRRTMAA
jgi:glycosyltransferase involved in cell wall biosynthesis